MIWVKRCLIVCIILLATLWFGGRWLLSFSVADYSGVVVAKGIKENVEITFDKKGIPQIWAKTDRDMYYSLGWLHASERLFHAEIIRRYAYGELSEIVGDIAFNLDVKQRKIGFARKAAEDLSSLDPLYRAFIESYCNGLNDWVESRTILPPEFVIMGFEPRKWTPEDVATILYYQTWYSHEIMDDDEDFQELISIVGAGLDSVLLNEDTWSPSTISKNDEFSYKTLPNMMSYASNAWAVSPSKSVSGHAMIASDPHLQVNSAPGFWYLAGLRSEEGTHFLGTTVPGIPVGIMGHNDSISVAFTVASVDLIDYYTEKKDPNDSLYVLRGDSHEKMQQHTESIFVKDEEVPRKVTVYKTSTGVVMNSDQTSVKTMHWAGFDFNVADILESMFKLNKAQNISDFRTNVVRLGALDVNWMYSDRKGNIAYQLASPVPKRNYNTYTVNIPSDSTTFSSYYPLEETPHQINPKKGWLATCNNKITPEGWDYPLPGFYDNWRIMMAEKQLNAKPKFDQKDFEEMQMDITSGIAVKHKQLLIAGAKKLGENDLVTSLMEWDGKLISTEKRSVLFRYWWYFLPKAVFQDELGEKWEMGGSAIEKIIEQNVTHVIDNKHTAEKETIEDASAIALKEALKFKQKPFASIHKVKHMVFGDIALLDMWLDVNRGAFPAHGDAGSLNQNFTVYDKKTQDFHQEVGASMRYVLDWGNIDGFTIQTNLGQSGNPFSPYYDNFLADWQEGKRWVVPFTKSKVYEKKSSVLTLVPSR